MNFHYISKQTLKQVSIHYAWYTVKISVSLMSMEKICKSTKFIITTSEYLKLQYNY